MIAAQKTEGPAENTHVIARSDATWKSRGSRNIPENRRDCHALRARNDAVVGGWSFYFTLLASGERHGGRSLRSALASRNCRAAGRAVLLDCRQVESISHEFVSGHWPQKQKDHPGGGWSFYPVPTRGAGTDWKRHSQSGTVNLTLHIIAKSRSFDNLWKVKLTLDFFRYVWKKKPEFATKW